jgi:hypothetical protein
MWFATPFGSGEVGPKLRLNIGNLHFHGYEATVADETSAVNLSNTGAPDRIEIKLVENRFDGST